MKNRTTRAGVTATVFLGAVIGACVVIEERGPRCWTDHAVDGRDCRIEQIRCLDDAADPEGFERCNERASRCQGDATEVLEQCEHRTGCFAEHSSCSEACGVLADEGTRSQCRDACTQDFQRCASWYDPDCESDCKNEAATCDAEADKVSKRVGCENNRAQCIQQCYED